MKKISRAYADFSLLKINVKFLGKVTREKQVREKKNHLAINIISLDFFSFKFGHLWLCFEVRYRH